LGAIVYGQSAVMSSSSILGFSVLCVIAWWTVAAKLYGVHKSTVL